MPAFRRLAALLVLATAAAPAAADDACLVGTWEPEGNAMLDWLRQRTPGMQFDHVQEAAVLQLHADGRYAADMRGRASARDGDRTVRASGQFGSSGRWRAASGELVLEPGHTGDHALVGEAGGRRVQVHAGPTGPQSLGYRCSGDRLETRIALPGTGDTVVQPYRRRK